MMAHITAWDTSHDWVLHCYWHDPTRVYISFKHCPPSVSELAALRRCVLQIRDMPPRAVRASIADSGKLALGVLPTLEARQLVESAKAEGLDVMVEMRLSLAMCLMTAPQAPPG